MAFRFEKIFDSGNNQNTGIPAQDITLGLNADDNRLYLYIDGEPVGNGIALPSGGASGDVAGNIDSENNIILSGGDIVAGEEYSFYYKVGDDLVLIGSKVLEEVEEPEPEEPEEPDNTPKINAINKDGTPFVGDKGEQGYKTGVRISGGSGEETGPIACCTTGFIAVTSGQKAVVENITPHSTDTNNVLAFYDESFAKVANTTLGSASVVENPSTGVYVIRPAKMAAASSIRYIRFSCGTITENSSVTVTDA